jgi:hypothetical protein
MRPLSLFFSLLILVILPSFLYLNYAIHTREQFTQNMEEPFTASVPEINNDVVSGPVVMPQLRNSTIKYVNLFVIIFF